MRIELFDYALPPERIAQEAVEPRDAARLFVHDALRDASEHRRVRDLPSLLRAGDLLVVNDTRVVPARLLGARASGGRVELLLVEPRDGDPRALAWRAFARPSRRLRAGEELAIGDGLAVRLVGRPAGAHGDPGALWDVELVPEPGRPVSALELLERHGHVPLPPYVERADGDPREARDRARYQTVYARHAGAVAAPTAGLHFTPELLERLATAGVEHAALTLHVGAGTFQPVQVDDLERHTMHAEPWVLPPQTAAAIERCRTRGGRVVAVGTTSLRVLETAARADGGVDAGSGRTELFVRPGHRFRCVDALLTNFHLPRSTLLVLVAAFVGRERALRLYGEALEHGYRFYSYGDAMLLFPASPRGAGSADEQRG